MPRRLMLLVCLAAPLLAFAADGPRLMDENTIGTRPDRRPKATLRVDVNMALVPVTVLDSHGRNVTGLEKENFRVYDGPEPRPIVSFSQQDAPITVGLVFDCSRSMREKFKTARTAPPMLYSRLNADDRSFLVTVSNRPRLVRGLTSNFEDIQSALLFERPDGSTSLLDAVYLSLQELKKAPTPRKALIVVSDGGENDSRYTMRELTSLAAEADAQIFTIGLYQNPGSVEEVSGPDTLGKLARASGGVDFVIGDVNDVKNAMSIIGTALHNEYVLGYYPPDHAQNGKVRRVKVQLMLPAGTPRVQVYARSRYYLP